MNLLYFGLGALLLVGAVVDDLWTTLWDEGGAGPFTARLMKWTWRALTTLAGGRSWVLSLAGPLVLVLTLAFWLTGIWAGWTLIFASGGDAIFDVIDQGSISWSDLLYFAGYSVFTLGNGGFAPREGVWQFTTVLSTGSGMLFVTLSVTYILQVLGAVSQKHAFADGVTGLGGRAEEIAQVFWNGEKFGALDLQLNTFTSQITTLTANHKAYPILHYFHSQQTSTDPVVAITILNELVVLLQHGIEDEHQPSGGILRSLESSIQSYLQTLESLHIARRPIDHRPPSPGLTMTREGGPPTVADDEFSESLDAERIDRRRRTLASLIQAHERQWPGSEDG